MMDTAFQADAFQNDAFQIATGSAVTPYAVAFADVYAPSQSLSGELGSDSMQGKASGPSLTGAAGGQSLTGRNSR